MSTRTRTLLVVAAVLAVAAVGVVVWWTSGDAPAEVDLDAALVASASPTPTGTAPTTATPTTGPVESPTATATGQAVTWTVTPDVVDYDFEASQGTFVGFRIDEVLVNQGDTVAVARTPDVTGSLTQHGTAITEASFTADLTSLESDRSQRERAIQSSLGTAANPEATFVATEPIELPSLPPVGEAFDAEARGDLTINGVTNEVTVPLRAALVEDDQLVVSSSFPVTLADYDIDAPSARIVASVADIATVEAQLYLVPEQG